jgi:hypothetical protein
MGISSGQTHYDGPRRRIACLMSESEIEGKFRKSEKVNQALFVMSTEERDPQKLQQYDENALCIFTDSELGDNMPILLELRDISKSLYIPFSVVVCRF